MSNIKLPADSEMRRMVASGLGRRNIATACGCGLSAVDARLKRLGLVAPLESAARPIEPDRMIIPTWIMSRLDGPITLPRLSIQARPYQEHAR